MERDFTYRGIKFHLNDNWNGANREFEGKYKLLWWHEWEKDHGYWAELITVNSKAEAMRALREFYKAKCRCFAY